MVLYRSTIISVQQEIDQEEDDDVDPVLVLVEKHGDQIYFYNKHTNDFIVQGKDMSEIAQKCETYFPDRYFCLEEEDVQKYNLKLENVSN